MKKATIVTVCVLICALTGVARTTTPIQIFGTGLDSGGSPLRLGAEDPHYQFVLVEGTQQAIVLSNAVALLQLPSSFNLPSSSPRSNCAPTRTRTRPFIGSQSVFSTLSDHADPVGFWERCLIRRCLGQNFTDMGSGHFDKSSDN
jgi:hypothetical protein